jgi:hypothetical protein
MPETAVYEDDKALLAKREIRPAEQRGMSPPSGDTPGAKQFRQSKLSLLVAASANAGHDLGAFGFSENVRHEGASPLRGGKSQFD